MLLGGDSSTQILTSGVLPLLDQHPQDERQQPAQPDEASKAEEELEPAQIGGGEVPHQRPDEPAEPEHALRRGEDDEGRNPVDHAKELVLHCLTNS